VDANGVDISANTRFGALRAETLLQLVCRTERKTPRCRGSPLKIRASRGAGCCSTRRAHFIPLPDIKRQIDGMAAAKLNVLHWHLTDDQGWRFSSKRYPKLTQLASDGLFYTPEQMREVVRYAAERGIRVVPEIDMPGHASAMP
jgi:hexosaminidase